MAIQYLKSYFGYFYTKCLKIAIAIVAIFLRISIVLLGTLGIETVKVRRPRKSYIQILVNSAALTPLKISSHVFYHLILFQCHFIFVLLKIKPPVENTATRPL